MRGSSNASAGRPTLLIFSPGAGRYFEGMAELTRDSRVPTRAELLGLMRRLDQEPIELEPG